jgi:DtxR family transcriptional regulator, Mn-dependent transcriptional regulator
LIEPQIALGIAVALAAGLYLLFRPQRGVVARWRRSRLLSERIRREDALKHIHEFEMDGDHPTLQSLSGALQLPADQATSVLSGLEADELVVLKGTEFSLTPVGRQLALHILRAHRLWESHLALETGYPATEWHDQADDVEHRLTEDELNALDARLEHPGRDPHGDPIPTVDGNLVRHGGVPLTAAEIDVPLRVVHLEDEPAVVFAQLVAEGLHAGMEIRLIEQTPHRVRFWAGGDEHVLAPIVASSIAVQPQAVPTMEAAPVETLEDLNPGEQAMVLRISPACRGVERRRLLDLGLLPGTVVGAEFVSPSGDPTAYRVRGASIALRDVQARFIEIQR